MEQWKPITGFEGYYEVSDLGRIRSINRIVKNRLFTGIILKPVNNTTGGYPFVCLIKNGKRRSLKIHKLVARAFIPNPLNLPHVNHTGEKSDNRAIKLEWRSTQGHGIDRSQRGQQGAGICFTKKTGKWGAYYNPVTGKQKWIGQNYQTAQAAKIARDKALSTLAYIQ